MIDIGDSQIVELLGLNWLTSELLRAGLEVAHPIRDRGVDLIAYADLIERTPCFVAKPIQMKAASKCNFGIDRKYEKISGLIIAYVWHLQSEQQSLAFALTYKEAVRVAEEVGYTATRSWIDKGKYSTTNPSQRLRLLLDPHQMTLEDWWNKVVDVASE